MKRNGWPIGDYHIQGGIDPRITYSQRFLEFSACAAMGLDLERWEETDQNVKPYSGWLKAAVITWYDLTKQIEVHTADAVNRAEKRRMKKKR